MFNCPSVLLDVWRLPTVGTTDKCVLNLDVIPHSALLRGFSR